jgi:hypothetical protein
MRARPEGDRSEAQGLDTDVEPPATHPHVHALGLVLKGSESHALLAGVHIHAGNRFANLGECEIGFAGRTLRCYHWQIDLF